MNINIFLNFKSELKILCFCLFPVTYSQNIHYIFINFNTILQIGKDIIQFDHFLKNVIIHYMSNFKLLCIPEWSMCFDYRYYQSTVVYQNYFWSSISEFIQDKCVKFFLFYINYPFNTSVVKFQFKKLFLLKTIEFLTKNWKLFLFIIISF